MYERPRFVLDAEYAEPRDWKEGSPLESGHCLEDYIGGQLEAGFVMTGFYEDRHRTAPLACYITTYVATCAQRP